MAAVDRIEIFDVPRMKGDKEVREFGWRYRSGTGGRHSNMGGPGESYARKPSLIKNAERITRRTLTTDRAQVDQDPEHFILLVDQST